MESDKYHKQVRSDFRWYNGLRENPDRKEGERRDWITKRLSSTGEKTRWREREGKGSEVGRETGDEMKAQEAPAKGGVTCGNRLHVG